MIKYLRDAGYIQIYLGLSLLSGFLITAFGSWIFSLSYLGLVFLFAGFNIIKDTSKQMSMMQEYRRNYKDVALPITLFYGVITAVAVFFFLIGLFIGA